MHVCALKMCFHYLPLWLLNKLLTLASYSWILTSLSSNSDLSGENLTTTVDSCLLYFCTQSCHANDVQWVVMHWGITHASAMVLERILTFRWHKATSSTCYTVNCHPEEYAYPSQSLVFSHFHSLICSYVSGRRSDIDGAVKDYCLTIYLELKCRPTSGR